MGVVTNLDNSGGLPLIINSELNRGCFSNIKFHINMIVCSSYSLGFQIDSLNTINLGILHISITGLIFAMGRWLMLGLRNEDGSSEF